MAGLPHYDNSFAASKLLEPLFLNQFEVQIIPPGAITGGGILLEHVTSLRGLTLDKTPDPISQKYKFAKRNYAGGKPDRTTMDVSLSFTVNLDDNNSMYVFKTLRQWCDLIYNPLTGGQGLKKDLVGTIIVSIFNKNGDVYRRITCKDVFPTKAIDNMPLNFTQEGVYEIRDMTWAVDHWDDLFL